VGKATNRLRWQAAESRHGQGGMKAKVELKSLMPEDAKEAIGHGLRAKRSKSGAARGRSRALEKSPPDSGHSSAQP
jgi:hypothetical protein